MSGLQIFAGPPYTAIPGNVISATVGLVYINQPEYELPTSTRVRLYQKFGKILVEDTVLSSYP